MNLVIFKIPAKLFFPAEKAPPTEKSDFHKIFDNLFDSIEAQKRRAKKRSANQNAPRFLLRARNLPTLDLEFFLKISYQTMSLVLPSKIS